MKTVSSLLVLSAALALSTSAGARTFHFSGEVSKGQEFRKELPRGLTLVLAPTAIEPGAIEGWRIKITPQGDHPAECDDFAWIATPPYRSYNPRYLDTSYATSAKDAVSLTPRNFRFVLTCSAYQEELRWVDRLLWPYNYSEAQVKQAEDRLGSSPLGNGTLRIRSHKISPAPNTANGTNLGQIDWIKFDVEIQIPGK